MGAGNSVSGTHRLSRPRPPSLPLSITFQRRVARIVATRADVQRVKVSRADNADVSAMDTMTESRRPRPLEDPSGRRLRRMRWLGRIVAVVFLLWFATILLGALGVGPAGRVPFGNSLRPSAGPPPLRRLPSPRPPTRSDLVPALSATVFAPAVRVARHGRVARPGHAAPAQAPGQLTPTGTAPGHSASAPGRQVTTTSPGHSASASGRQVTTTSAGHSASAHDHAPVTTTPATTTTTTPARVHAVVSAP